MTLETNRNSLRKNDNGEAETKIRCTLNKRVKTERWLVNAYLGDTPFVFLKL